jgi:hypothetical protein
MVFNLSRAHNSTLVCRFRAPALQSAERRLRQGLAMPFNSFTFVLFFFAVFIIHSLPLPRIVRKLNLLLASYLFYAAWEPWFVALLVYATLVNWIAGKILEAWDDRPRRRKIVLWSAVLLNIGLLAAFKYGNELLALSQVAATKLGLPYAPVKTTILLPIGLSFFTFQSLSYTIDVYRGRSSRRRRFSTWLSLFHSSPCCWPARSSAPASFYPNAPNRAAPAAANSPGVCRSTRWACL